MGPNENDIHKLVFACLPLSHSQTNGSKREEDEEEGEEEAEEEGEKRKDHQEESTTHLPNSEL
jgi:hypothetical protein